MMNALHLKNYIGLMSGTSLDGIDASLIKTDGNNNIALIENLHFPYTEEFKKKIKKFFEIKINSGFLEAEKELTELHIKAVLSLLAKTGLTSTDIEAIGFHGQTIYHNPGQGFIWQMGNPFMMAAATQIKTVYDFRKLNIAYGGQGAPLIPIFHKAIMSWEENPVAVINIGGVANITYINGDDLIAFDPGPGNALIDDACQKYWDLPYDKDGKIAAAGKADTDLVHAILKTEYFVRPYPKSLDRNEFKFVEQSLNLSDKTNIITTLTYLTGAAIALALRQLPQIPKKIYLCGGGSRNSCLTELISELVNKNHTYCQFVNINQKPGLDPDFIEAQGFAYLAARRCLNLPSAFPSTTGASRESICGLIVEP